MSIEVKNKHTPQFLKLYFIFAFFGLPLSGPVLNNRIFMAKMYLTDNYLVFMYISISYVLPFSIFSIWLRYICNYLFSYSHTSIYLYILPLSSLPIFRPFLAEITPWILWIKILALLPLLLLNILQILGLHIPWTVRPRHRYIKYR